MIVRILKNNRLEGMIFIIFLMILVWLRFIFSSTQELYIDAMPLYNLLFGGIAKNPLSSALAGALIYGIMVVLLIRMNIRFMLLEERSFLPGTFLVLIASTFPGSLLLNPLLISSLFLIAALSMLFGAHDDEKGAYTLFKASLILGFGSLFYLKLIWFIPALWLTVVFIRQMSWREFLHPIIVFLMIALFYYTWFWVIRDDISAFKEMLHTNLRIEGSIRALKQLETIQAAYLLLLITISSLYTLNWYQARKTITRKHYLVLFMLFIYSLLFFLLSGFMLESIVFTAIPLAFLFGNFFNKRKTHWSLDILILLWLALIVAGYFF